MILVGNKSDLEPERTVSHYIFRIQVKFLSYGVLRLLSLFFACFYFEYLILKQLHNVHQKFHTCMDV